MKLQLVRGLRVEILGDELVVLDSSSGVVHRLSGAARQLVEQVQAAGSTEASNDDEVALALVEAGVLVAEGGPISRRAMLGLAAGLGIVTLSLPDAAAASSGGPGATSPPVDGSGVSTTTTSTTTTTVAPQVPATISGMTGSDISGESGAGAIRLTFTTPNNNGSTITAYKVYRTVSGSDSLFQTINASEGPLDLTGLTRGTSYTFKVAAVNSVGEAAKSNAVTATPAALVPSQVSNLSATAGAGSITLSFTAPDDNGATITSYEVYRTVSGTDSLFTTYSGAAGPIEIDMLDPTESYTFKVAAVNSEGKSAKSASDTATPTAVATGGTVSYFTPTSVAFGVPGVKYAVHKFVNDEGGTGSAAAISADFVLNAERNLDYLVVAGGGSGGSAANTGAEGTGGGGAGGVREGSSVSYSPGTYAVVVSGRTTAPNGTNTSGNNGGTSSFGAISATGGGGGGKHKAVGNSGGSGGGGGGRGTGENLRTAGGAGNAGGYSPVEGYAGGSSRDDNSSGRSAGGGGGGAGNPGGTGGTNATIAGNGGPGVGSVITGTSVALGGGGGGGALDTNEGANETAGTGGAGGGGNGSTSGNASPGTNGRGGGGGGVGTNGNGGAGGSGIVVIRYPVTKLSY